MRDINTPLSEYLPVKQIFNLYHRLGFLDVSAVSFLLAGDVWCPRRRKKFYRKLAESLLNEMTESGLLEKRSCGAWHVLPDAEP